jgi:DNA-binding CsgD family transcriptional regulator
VAVGDVLIDERALARALDVVSPDAVATAGVEIPEGVLTGLAGLVPCGRVHITVCRRKPGRRLTDRPDDVSWQGIFYQDFPGWSSELEDLYWAAAPECVAYSGLADMGVEAQVSVWQDFYSERTFSQLLMAEFHQRQDIYHRLTVRLRSTHGVERRISLFRPPGDPPFTERDKVLLRVLRPHLASIHDRVEARRQSMSTLTPRQRDLVRHLALGKSNRQLAHDLGLAEGTVRKHLEKLYRNLGVHSRAEALARVATVATP